MPKAKTKNSMPASPRPIRALMLFETLPPGHMTFCVRNDGSSPHLNEGEFAVIDTTDHEPQHGELFVKETDTPFGPRRRIVQVRAGMCHLTRTGRESPVWWLRDLAGFRRVGSMSGIPSFEGLSDGPFDAAEGYLQGKLVGRVVGYATSPFGREIAAEAEEG